MPVERIILNEGRATFGVTGTNFSIQNMLQYRNPPGYKSHLRKATLAAAVEFDAFPASEDTLTWLSLVRGEMQITSHLSLLALEAAWREAKHLRSGILSTNRILAGSGGTDFLYSEMPPHIEWSQEWEFGEIVASGRRSFGFYDGFQFLIGSPLANAHEISFLVSMEIDLEWPSTTKMKGWNFREMDEHASAVEAL